MDTIVGKLIVGVLTKDKKKVESAIDESTTEAKELIEGFLEGLQDDYGELTVAELKEITAKKINELASKNKKLIGDKMDD